MVKRLLLARREVMVKRLLLARQELMVKRLLLARRELMVKTVSLGQARTFAPSTSSATPSPTTPSGVCVRTRVVVVVVLVVRARERLCVWFVCVVCAHVCMRARVSARCVRGRARGAATGRFDILLIWSGSFAELCRTLTVAARGAATGRFDAANEGSGRGQTAAQPRTNSGPTRAGWRAARPWGGGGAPGWERVGAASRGLVAALGPAEGFAPHRRALRVGGVQTLPPARAQQAGERGGKPQQGAGARPARALRGGVAVPIGADPRAGPASAGSRPSRAPTLPESARERPPIDRVRATPALPQPTRTRLQSERAVRVEFLRVVR